jgi:hypothetical protein
VLGFEVRRPFLVIHVALLVTGETVLGVPRIHARLMLTPPPCWPCAGCSLLATLAPMAQAQRDLWALHDKRDPNIVVLLLSQKFRCMWLWLSWRGRVEPSQGGCGVVVRG